MANTSREINSKNKKVILHVISGCGFSLLKGSIIVHAKLMNQKLETPIIPVHTNELKINKEIAWYLDILDLKKLKMANTSVKIECIHLPTNNSSSNKMLGYILLKVKEAQTVNPTSNDRIETKCYKLIGSKNCNYNFIMSFRIENFNNGTIESLPKKIKHLKLNNSKNINDNTNHLDDEVENNKQFEENMDFEEKVELDLQNNSVYMLKQTEHLPTKNKPINVFNFDVQQKLIEELEEWKNKQIILFNEKVKIKEEQLLKEFNEKWFDDRKHLEEDLSHEISKCKASAENLDNMANTVKEKEAFVMAKELELARLKGNTDNNYCYLVRNLQCTHEQIINELTNRVVQLTTKLYNLEKVNILFKKENEQLKNNINTNHGFRVQHLENMVSNLERKCAEANQSSMFYKERWITSVKKINQISSKLYENTTNKLKDIGK